MDQELKARKLASMAARKQRFAERQRQNDLLREQRGEQEKKMPQCNEVYITGSGSESSRSSSPENDSSAETPSESSLRTPNNSFSSPEVEIKTQPLHSSPHDAAKQEADADAGRKPSLLERRRSKKSKATLQQSMFTASLNRPCDFRYDRFSTIVEPAEVKAGGSEEGDVSSSSEESDEEEDYSPIEVATPIAIRMPGSRPSVVSVLSQGQQRFSATNINTIMINPSRPTMTKSYTTGSMANIKPNNGSSLLAAEIKPTEGATPSSASITSVDASSTRSLPPAEQPAVDVNLKKKSSMPILTKFRHSRMNSIKNFIKPHSISGATPAVPQVPASHQSRPSGAASDILLSATTHKTKATGSDSHRPPSPRRSVTESALPQVQPQQEQRPQTARMSTQPSVTAMLSPATVGTAASQRTPSIAPSIAPSTAPSVDENENAAMTKKKSFSNLRRRSGSLGQALRFSSSRSKSPAPEAPMPPVPLMPLIHVPTKESVESANFSTPPPKTPKNARKSGMMMMYSPFPPSTQKGEPVGLGLRM